jgi:aspartate racemase
LLDEIASMTTHIGIVGCSAEGAALCYRTICQEGSELLGAHRHPEVSMHTPPLSEYVDCLERDDLDGVARLMLASAEKLASIGAGLIICPDNTIHQAFDRVTRQSAVPWLHIAEIVVDHAVARGYRRLGLLGTRWLVGSAVYPEKAETRGLECVRPTLEQRNEVSRIIMDELVLGHFRSASSQYLVDTITALKAEGCDAVVLGCTELPLVINDHNSPLPTLDSTRLLARAALRRAMDSQREAASRSPLA